LQLLEQRTLSYELLSAFAPTLITMLQFCIVTELEQRNLSY